LAAIGSLSLGGFRVEFGEAKNVGTVLGLDLAANEHAEQLSVPVVDFQLILFDEPNGVVIGRVEAASAKEIIPN
jgi:hypothetical protein